MNESIAAHQDRLRDEVAEMRATRWMPATVKRLPPKNRTRNSKRRIIR